MLDAATQFKKNSFNEEDSAILAEVAAKFTNIADTQISSADAASFLISQMKAFNIEAENSEHIIDAVFIGRYRVNCGKLLMSFLLIYDSDVHRGKQ